MSLLTKERPNRPVPLETVAENLSKEQTLELLKTVRYYASFENWKVYLISEFEPSPEGSEIEQDRGAKARKTLKEMGLK
jgi:hypothetical protein